MTTRPNEMRPKNAQGKKQSPFKGAASDTQTKRLLNSSIIGALDQALLSVFNLAIGILFIKLGTKEDYAEYALASTTLLLIQSIQNAVVNSPQSTLQPAESDDAKRAEIRHAGQFTQTWLKVLLILIAGIVTAICALTVQTSLIPGVLTLTFAGIGVVSREYVRAQHFLHHEPTAALRSDISYVLVASLMVGGSIWLENFSTLTMLCAIGTAGTLTSVSSSKNSWKESYQLGDAERNALSAVWKCARWSLPSVINSWLYANSFLYIVEHTISKEAVADLSASRLLLVPMSLLVVGWSSAFRPRASRWLATGEVKNVQQVAGHSAVSFMGLGIAYGAMLYVLMPFAEKGIFGEKYAGLSPLVSCWLLFFTATAVRSVGMSAMLAHVEAFRTLYWYGWAALAVALPGIVVASAGSNLIGVLASMICAEFLLCGLIWLRGWPSIRRLAMGKTA